MNTRDRDLGMDRPISRRDLLHGMGAIAAASLVPGRLVADQVLAEVAAGYPPALTGMRGNHDGSFDVAHKLAMMGKTDWGKAADSRSGDCQCRRHVPRVNCCTGRTSARLAHRLGEMPGQKRGAG